MVHNSKNWYFNTYITNNTADTAFASQYQQTVTDINNVKTSTITTA